MFGYEVQLGASVFEFLVHQPLELTRPQPRANRITSRWLIGQTFLVHVALRPHLKWIMSCAGFIPYKLCLLWSLGFTKSHTACHDSFYFWCEHTFATQANGASHLLFWETQLYSPLRSLALPPRLVKSCYSLCPTLLLTRAVGLFWHVWLCKPALCNLRMQPVSTGLQTMLFCHF